MIQLTAIVDGKRSVMLTGESIEEAERSCRDRFGRRFEGFGPIPTETKARSKWAEYRAKAITRDELEAWLKEQDDEQEIREELNKLRGGVMVSTTKAAYLMARLTTKGIRPGEPFGGVPELSRADIAAACTRLDSLSFHLIMAKYCDDVYSALEALGDLQEDMCKQSQLWAEMDPLRRSHIAAAIIDEFVASKKCRRCKGTGEAIEWKQVVSCKSCDGTGQLPVSATSRAKSCGIPESTFRSQGLMGPFQEVMHRLSDIEIGALERISRKAS